MYITVNIAVSVSVTLYVSYVSHTSCHFLLIVWVWRENTGGLWHNIFRESRLCINKVQVKAAELYQVRD